MPSLRDALRDRVVVLDGGLATELEARGHDLTSALWSARLLVDDPAAIRAAHAAFFAAGAEIATTASYQASFAGLSTVGDPAKLMRRSVELAREARDEHGSGWVAASVGPYGAVLADGSEYRGDYALSVDELRAFHRDRLAVLARAGADVLAIETIPCLAEVEAVLTELDAFGVPAWLSVTCADGRTRAGEPLSQAFAMARDSNAVIAVGVNCTDPREVADAVSLAVEVSGKPGVAYPNSGETWNASARCWSGSPRFDEGFVGQWIANGARLVGGCCRVGPEQIAEIAATTRPATGPPR